MAAEAVTKISTYFRVCDGVRIRYADNQADSDVTVLLLAPWPESLWAFRRIWDRSLAAVGRVVAVDLPGFGHSDGRPELIAPDSSGAFLARMIDEWDLGAPHLVGPDVGTAAALFLAAKAPERVTSLTIGGGAVRLPIEAGGASRTSSKRRVWTWCEGSTPGPTSAMRSSLLLRALPNPRSMRTTSAPTTSGASESARFVWHYPEQNPVLRVCCHRLRRRPKSWPANTMTSCRGRTTSTSTTSSPTAKSILSTPVTSHGKKQPTNTAA